MDGVATQSRRDLADGGARKSFCLLPQVKIWEEVSTVDKTGETLYEAGLDAPSLGVSWT